MKLSDNSNNFRDKSNEKSVVLSMLDRFAGKVYGLISGGLFGKIFTSYSSDPGVIVKKITRKNKLSDVFDSFRRRVAKKIENSAVYNIYNSFIKMLFSIKVRVYGVAALTFFIYAAAVNLYGYFNSASTGIPVEFIRFVFLAISAIPLVLSNLPLYNMLEVSVIGHRILSVSGNLTDVYETDKPRGKCNIAFIVGTILGLLTFFVPAGTICILFLRAVWIMAVLNSPEFGIVSLFFLMPFEATMTLVVEVAVVFVSFILKCILGKRTIKFEAVGLAALMFALMIVVGGVFSVSNQSLKPMLVYLCFMSVFFLITSLIRSAEWINRCIISAVLSATIVALYGIFQYITGAIGFSTQWLDTTMFGDISGRAVSTLENPNVLGEYLVMIIPMAALILIFKCSGIRQRFFAFLAFASLSLCLIITWSRGSWLGMMVAALLFCLILSKRTLHLFWLGVLSLPLLPTILPDNILARLTSIGNVADSSTSYRLNIWLGTIKMLPENIFSGIGIGYGAWKEIYPNYALDGMTDVQHSHSLYFQIWVELGAVALVIFAAFIVILLMSNFTMYKSLSSIDDSMISRIYIAPLKDSSLGKEKDAERRAKRSMIKARTHMRMIAAAPLCGIVGILIQGFTDNIWYNYRVYLMLWLCLGLCAASSAFVRERVESANNISANIDPTKAFADISIARAQKAVSNNKNTTHERKDDKQ